MKTIFEAGQTVYNEHGEQAEYVADAGDGHIVRPIVEACGHDGDDGPYDHVCDPTMWRSVFAQPPVAKYSADLKALHEQIAAAKTERSQIENEVRQRARERAEKFKRFAVLDNVEAFVDGKITHYVTLENYGPPSIIAIEEAKSRGSDNWRQQLRLLTLGGDMKNGGIHWILNEYSDGSGSGKGVVPCTSYEQASEIVKAAIIKHFADTSPNRTPRQDWIDGAEKMGVAVPDDYRRAVAVARIRAIEQNLNYTRSQAANSAESLRKAEEELAQLRAYVTPTPAQGEQ